MLKSLIKLYFQISKNFLFKLFENIRKTHHDYKEKLVGIEGDLLEPNLGISDEDRKLLIENVNFITF